MTRTRKRPAPRPAPRKPRGSGHERRAEILAAAKDMFAREGFAEVTTRALARRAGLSQTGLYLYFRTKEEILAAIRAQTFEQLTLVFREALAGGGTGTARFRRLMRSYVDFGMAHPVEYQLTFTIAPEFLAPQERKFERPPGERDIGVENFVLFRDALSTLMADTGLAGRDPMLVAQLLWFAGHGAVSLMIARPHFPWVEREALIETMIDVLLDGLARR